jgi:hypothetical protein
VKLESGPEWWVGLKYYVATVLLIVGIPLSLPLLATLIAYLVTH